MKKILTLIVVFSTISILAYSQSSQSRIDKINSYTSTYDPYKRHFTYDASLNRITFVTGDGGITIKIYLKDVNISVTPSTTGSNYYVTWTCKSGKCIESTYSGNTDITSITITSKSIADAIADELRGLSSGTSSYSNISSGYQTHLDKINYYTNLYDPYKRHFTYDPNSNKITFICADGDGTISLKLDDVNVAPDISGSSSYVTFKCKSGGQCMYSSYNSSKTCDATSVTINNKDAVNSIVAELLAMSGSSSYSNISSGKERPAAPKY